MSFCDIIEILGISNLSEVILNYFNLKEIPVPAGARPDGNRVYVMRDIGGGERNKLYIGIYARKDEGTFYANDNFRLFFPSLWVEHYGDEQISPHFLELGVYLLSLLISHKTGLYPALHDNFGPLNGNAMLDFAVYSIKERKNAAYLFKPAMEQSVLFSKDRFDDGFLSTLFNEQISLEQIDKFRLAWLQACKTRGISNVWLTVDGTNNNCETDTPLSQQGKAKSLKNIPVVSYIWAVNAGDGTPVTFFVNEGSTVDSKAIAEVTTYLKANNIQVKGFILDRAFLSHEVLNDVVNAGYDYVVKLKSDTYAHKNMVNAFGRKICWNTNYLIGENALFGIVRGPYKIFKDNDDRAFIGLYFDGKNGSERKVTQCNKIYKARQAVIAQIQNGEEPSIGEGMSSYLKLVKLQGPGPAEGEPSDSYYLVLRRQEGEQLLFQKGFDSIAFTQKTSAAKANRTYHLRDASEKQFMICKTMIGSSVFRSHKTEGIESRALEMFLAAILRNDLMNACKEIGLDLPRLIEELDSKLFLVQMSDGTYTLINKATKKMQALLNHYGVTTEDLQTITGAVTERERSHGKGISQYHDLPAEIRQRNEKRRRKQATKHTPKEDADPTEPVKTAGVVKEHRGPGRPPGRKNNKTLQREAAELAAGKQAGKPPRRGPGRPPGRKNNKTLERESRELASGNLPAQKRKRGRPAGSRDSIPRRRRTKAEMEQLRRGQN